MLLLLMVHFFYYTCSIRFVEWHVTEQQMPFACGVYALCSSTNCLQDVSPSCRWWLTGVMSWLWLLCRRLFLTWAAATRANHPKENVVVDMFLAEYAENAVKVEVGCQLPAYWRCCAASGGDSFSCIDAVGLSTQCLAGPFLMLMPLFPISTNETFFCHVGHLTVVLLLPGWSCDPRRSCMGSSMLLLVGLVLRAGCRHLREHSAFSSTAHRRSKPARHW